MYSKLIINLKTEVTEVRVEVISRITQSMLDRNTRDEPQPILESSIYKITQIF